MPYSNDMVVSSPCGNPHTAWDCGARAGMMQVCNAPDAVTFFGTTMPDIKPEAMIPPPEIMPVPALSSAALDGMSDALPGVLDALAGQRSGRFDAGMLARASLARAHASQAQLQAFVSISAAPPDRPASTGPLAGIAIGVKDLIATADLITTSGSPLYADHLPAADAWVVARLRSLGAFVAGKTVTTEFAWRQPGPTRNPWNLAHTPGGSSSGSAAAVAAGIVPAALGTQTLGSIIRPAAFCGVVGMKPSHGAIARTGIAPLAGSLDHVGVFARSVSDAGYLLGWLIGNDAGDPQANALPGWSLGIDEGVPPAVQPRIAVMRSTLFDAASAAQQQQLLASAEAFRAAGAIVTPFELPPAYDSVWDDTMILLEAEAAVIYGALCDRHGARISGHIHSLVERGRGLRAEAYLQARGRQAALRLTLGQLLSEHDAILTMPAAGTAPAGLEDTGDARFCTPWSFLGVPAIALPAALAGNGLPLGIQLVAAYRQDLHLLRVARWCETVLAFAHRSRQYGL